MLALMVPWSSGFAEDSSVLVRNLSTPGTFEVENRGPDIALAWSVAVQRQDKGQWNNEVTSLSLIQTCGAPPPPDCFHLTHGAKIRPVQWNGLTCASQCAGACRANVYLGPGHFRLVVSSCEGRRKFTGPAFDLPAREPK